MNKLRDGLPRGRKARLGLYNQWAQAALQDIVGQSNAWNVRVIQYAIGVGGKQWQIRVEGPDGGFTRDIDISSTKEEIYEVVRSAHDEVSRHSTPFARL